VGAHTKVFDHMHVNRQKSSFDSHRGAKIAAQRVAAAELLQDTHHTYIDDEGTRRYTRGAKGKGRV
jgi:hypothetical protein